jgi:hypothetical protein
MIPQIPGPAGLLIVHFRPDFGLKLISRKADRIQSPALGIEEKPKSLSCK